MEGVVNNLGIVSPKVAAKGDILLLAQWTSKVLSKLTGYPDNHTFDHHCGAPMPICLP